MAAADEATPIELGVAAGQRPDAPLLRPLLGKTAARVGVIGEVVGGKGFDGRPQRQACRDRGAEPVIPAKKNRVGPEPLDAGAYRGRNRVERLFAKLEEFRRAATRYDERKRMLLGWVHLALGFIRLRAKTNVNRA